MGRQKRERQEKAKDWNEPVRPHRHRIWLWSLHSIARLFCNKSLSHEWSVPLTAARQQVEYEIESFYKFIKMLTFRKNNKTFFLCTFFAVHSCNSENKHDDKRSEIWLTTSSSATRLPSRFRRRAMDTLSKHSPVALPKTAEKIMNRLDYMRTCTASGFRLFFISLLMPRSTQISLACASRLFLTLMLTFKESNRVFRKHKTFNLSVKLILFATRRARVDRTKSKTLEMSQHRLIFRGLEDSRC